LFKTTEIGTIVVNKGSGENKKETTAKTKNTTVDCNQRQGKSAENNSLKGAKKPQTGKTSKLPKRSRGDRRRESSRASKPPEQFIDSSWSIDSNGYNLMDKRRADIHQLICIEFEEELRTLMTINSGCSKSETKHETTPGLLIQGSTESDDSKDGLCYRTDLSSIEVCKSTPDPLNTDPPNGVIQSAKSQLSNTFDVEKALSIIDFEVFGSTTMDLVIPGASDVDINVKFNCDNPLRELGYDYKKNALDLVLKKVSEHDRIEVIEVRRFARVPVIKVKYSAKNDDDLLDSDMIEIHGDITFSHSLPRYNSNLLRAYGQWDPMLRRLMMMVKYWSSQRGVKDASKGYLSSYSFMLLTVFYGQVSMGTPVLQKGESKVMKRFGLKSIKDVLALVPVNESGWKRVEVVEFPEFKGDQSMLYTMSATEHCLILLNFLEFLDHLPLHSHSISVRSGSLIPKTQRIRLKGEDWRWSIEDPYEHFESNAPRDLGCVLRESSVMEMHQEIDRAIILLRSWYYEDYYFPNGGESIDIDFKEKQASNILKQIFYKKVEVYSDNCEVRADSKDVLTIVPDEDSTSEYNDKYMKVGGDGLRLRSMSSDNCIIGREDWEFRPSFSSSSMSSSDPPSEVDDNTKCYSCPDAYCSLEEGGLIEQQDQPDGVEGCKGFASGIQSVQDKPTVGSTRCNDGGLVRSILMEALGVCQHQDAVGS